MPRFTLFAVLTISALTAPPSDAGSLAPYPLLGTINKVHLTVSGGSLGYEPIAGLDDEALVHQMEKRCEETLRLGGLEMAEPAEAYFSVAVYHAWNDRTRDMVALLIVIDLKVLAEPVDPATKALVGGKPTIAIWSGQRLELAQSADSGRIILEALESALEDFVEDRRAAQLRTAVSTTD